MCYMLPCATCCQVLHVAKLQEDEARGISCGSHPLEAWQHAAYLVGVLGAHLVGVLAKT